MGHFGRISTIEDLPSDRELTRLIKTTVALNMEGIKPPRASSRFHNPAS
jgi:hypothetical protein